MMDLDDDVVPYVVCAIPALLVVWSWILTRRHTVPGLVTWRVWLSRASLLFASLSAAVLLIFPGVLHHLESTHSTRQEAFYIGALEVGCLAALTAFAVAPFAAGRPRALLLVSTFVLMAVWFLVGGSY